LGECSEWGGVGSSVSLLTILGKERGYVYPTRPPPTHSLSTLSFSALNPLSKYSRNINAFYYLLLLSPCGFEQLFFRHRQCCYQPFDYRKLNTATLSVRRRKDDDVDDTVATLELL
jgi:hypothetical protein